jgi:hypothetical protein
MKSSFYKYKSNPLTFLPMSRVEQFKPCQCACGNIITDSRSAWVERLFARVPVMDKKTNQPMKDSKNNIIYSVDLNRQKDHYFCEPLCNQDVLTGSFNRDANLKAIQDWYVQRFGKFPLQFSV